MTPLEISSDQLSIFRKKAGRHTSLVFVILILALARTENAWGVCVRIPPGLTCTIWRGEKTVSLSLWNSVEINDETSGFVRLCNLPRYLVAIQGTTMKRRRKKKTCCHPVKTTPHIQRQGNKETGKCWGKTCVLFTYHRGLRRPTVKYPQHKLEVPWHFKGEWGTLPESRHFQAKMSQERFITELIRIHSRWHTVAFRMENMTFRKE